MQDLGKLWPLMIWASSVQTQWCTSWKGMNWRPLSSLRPLSCRRVLFLRQWLWSGPSTRDSFELSLSPSKLRAVLPKQILRSGALRRMLRGTPEWAVPSTFTSSLLNWSLQFPSLVQFLHRWHCGLSGSSSSLSRKPRWRSPKTLTSRCWRIIRFVPKRKKKKRRRRRKNW